MTFFRSTSTAALLLVALLLGSSSVAARKNECQDIKDLKELRNLLKEHDVFVTLIDDDDLAEENKKAYDELCNRLTATPSERVGSLAMGKIKVTKENRKVAKVLLGEDDAKTLKDKGPEYFAILKNAALSTPEEAIRFQGEEKSADPLTDFIAEKIPDTGRLGTWVYSLDHFDTLASLFVQAEPDTFWRKALAYCAKGLTYTMQIRTETKPIADIYANAMMKSIDSAEYFKKQVERLEKMLENDANKMSLQKKEELTQKIHTLQKFTEPKEVTKETYWKFFTQVVMTLLSMVLLPPLLLMSVYSMIFGEDEEEPKEKKVASDEEVKKDEVTKDSQ
eukprot:CAMPEP_0168784296 /NCGR_PEP_ID=MMETSP0725-20121227/10146_1 /TAXON_ID=265536 /ORGANISM="Amphiprora sp., Strain CCMP467" /LENGTH=334 /DNA_ID=CAMNT_0008834335 /DNA_START=49 /DNA_END=1053 /DNA_ORIENTATION=+